MTQRLTSTVDPATSRSFGICTCVPFADARPSFEPSRRERALKGLAVFPGSQRVTVAELEPPRLAGASQVLLRVRDVGICGTDREICSFEYGTPPSGDDHLVIGHEALAEVIDVGPGVEGLRAGDLVVPTVRRPCPHPHCLPCRSGHQDYCYTGDFTERGIKEAHGYLAEHVVEREPNLVVVPPDLESLAVLTEPLTIAEKALAQVFWLMQHRPPWLSPDTPPEQRGRGLSALVLGVGPVGILGAMALAVSGFQTYVYSRELAPSPRTDLVAAIGAVYVSSQTTTASDLASHIGNIDVVYEAVGHSHFALEVLRVLGHNGIYVLTGIPGPQAFIEADSASLVRDMVLKNQVLFGTVNAGADAFAAAVAHLGEFHRLWPDVTGTLIGGRYPLEQAPELIFGRPAGIKTVISF
jgi:glucose 1-dehydrogenase